MEGFSLYSGVVCLFKYLSGQNTPVSITNEWNFDYLFRMGIFDDHWNSDPYSSNSWGNLLKFFPGLNIHFRYHEIQMELYILISFLLESWMQLSASEVQFPFYVPHSSGRGKKISWLEVFTIEKRTALATLQAELESSITMTIKLLDGAEKVWKKIPRNFKKKIQDFFSRSHKRRNFSDIFIKSWSQQKFCKNSSTVWRIIFPSKIFVENSGNENRNSMVNFS